EGLGVYFDKAHRVAAAIAADLELHSKKKDKDLHVGDILTLEGGLGGRFAKGAGAYGLAYYAQWKVSDDSGADLPVVELSTLNLLGKQHLYGFGPELTIPFFAKGTTVGLATVRYFWETGGRSTFEGRALFLAVTLAKLWGAVMDDAFSRFASHLIGRLHGPLTMRIWLQPLTATVLAARDGYKDARAHKQPYFATMVAHPEQRDALLREGAKAVARVLTLGAVMDSIYQSIVFGWSHPIELVVVVLLLAFVLYLLMRGTVNRIARHMIGPGVLGSVLVFLR